MTEPATEDHGAHFGFASWIRTPWFGFNWGYSSVSNASSGEDTEASGQELTDAVNPSPSDSNVPPAPPNTPPQRVNGETQETAIVVASESEEQTDERQLLLNATPSQGESSWMAANRSVIIPTLALFENKARRPRSSKQLVESSSSIEIGSASDWNLTLLKCDCLGQPINERTCLICLEPLTDEEFTSGAAISLGCDCRGDAAFRHKECAQKWVNIKGDRVCDVCRAPITNLVAPPTPRSEAQSDRIRDLQIEEDLASRHQSPGDLFHCLRLTWILTIVSVIFFGLRITEALISGLLAAVLYTGIRRVIRNRQRRQIELLAATNQGNQTVETRPTAVPAVIV